MIKGVILLAEQRHRQSVASKKDSKKPIFMLVPSSDKQAAEAAFRKAMKIVMENVTAKQENGGKL